MPSDHEAPKAGSESATSDALLGRRPLTAAAERALAEAAARRAQREPADQPVELHGRGGLDPIRYGDWEINGLAADF
jgi:hypothetical protein